VVAVIIGALLGGETVGRRTILGTALILVSVVAITTTKARRLTKTCADGAQVRQLQTSP